MPRLGPPVPVARPQAELASQLAAVVLNDDAQIAKYMVELGLSPIRAFLPSASARSDHANSLDALSATVVWYQAHSFVGILDPELVLRI